MNTTLPTDSEERKRIPLVSGCLDYFPAALAGVARVSHAGNEKHNPGQPLHHARGKSTDHADCVVRHLVDLQGLLATLTRSEYRDETIPVTQDAALAEASALAWRALALSQELHERFGAPLAPGARLPGGDVRAHGAVGDGQLEPVDHTPESEPGPVTQSATYGRVEVTVRNIGPAPVVLGEFDGSQRVVLPVSAAVPPFRVEAGKRYVRRDGSVSGVLWGRHGAALYPFQDEWDTYTAKGQVYTDREDWGDLVAEYLPESGD